MRRRAVGEAMSQAGAPGRFEGKVAALIGRFGILPRRAVGEELERQGGMARRALTRRTDLVVIGERAVAQLASGRLEQTLGEAERQGTPCIGETAFLRVLGLLAPAEREPAALSLGELAAKVQLAPELVRLLVLFDLIDDQDGSISFRDLVTAREVKRLLGQGIALPEILQGVGLLVGGGAGSRPLARHKLVCDQEGHLLLRMDGGFAELDGQMRLPLPAARNPPVDAVFEAAEEAEQLRDWPLAEKLYRRCVSLERSDPIAPFNLANVLREGGRRGEAKCFLQLTLSIDSEFAEAWYNLAILLEEEGRGAAARAHLRRAIDCDPFYGDPMFNLASAYFRAGDHAQALEWWQRYLDLDPDSAWSQKARHGLAVCQAHLRGEAGR